MNQNEYISSIALNGISILVNNIELVHNRYLVNILLEIFLFGKRLQGNVYPLESQSIFFNSLRDAFVTYI